jgi:hypothetical protein
MDSEEEQLRMQGQRIIDEEEREEEIFESIQPHNENEISSTFHNVIIDKSKLKKLDK